MHRQPSFTTDITVSRSNQTASKYLQWQTWWAPTRRLSCTVPIPSCCSDINTTSTDPLSDIRFVAAVICLSASICACHTRVKLWLYQYPMVLASSRVVHYNAGNIHVRTSPLTGENKVEEGGADETFHTKGSGRGDPMKCQWVARCYWEAPDLYCLSPPLNLTSLCVERPFQPINQMTVLLEVTQTSHIPMTWTGLMQGNT